MKLKAQMMPLEKSNDFFSDVTFFQTPFWVGGDVGFGSCVYDTFCDVQTSLLEREFEYSVYCL